MFKKFALFGLASMFIAMFACTPKISSVGPETRTEKELVYIPAARAAWEVEWDRTLMEARREGKVIIYTGPRAHSVQLEIMNALNRRFGLKLDLEWVAGRSEEIYRKLLAERQARIYAADILLGGVSSVDVLKPAGVLDDLEPQLVLPEVLDPKVWWQGGVPFVDEDKKMVALGASPLPPLTINTNYVKEKDIKSHYDLLDPKWKGKIIMDDPTIAGQANSWFVAFNSSKTLRADFMRQLAGMDITILRDKRLEIEWLASGKFFIGLGLSTTPVMEFIQAGAPLAMVTPVEGTYITSGGGNLALLNRAPHANAARVFINWLLTREGHIIYQNATQFHSTRLDVPTSNIHPSLVRQEGVKYLNRMDEEYRKVTGPEQTKVAIEIFRPLMR